MKCLKQQELQYPKSVMAVNKRMKKSNFIMCPAFKKWLQRAESNRLPLANKTSKLPMLYPAIILSNKKVWTQSKL